MSNESDIQQMYDALDADKIPKFIELVELALNKNQSSPYYNMTRSITDNVTKFKSLSYKQFRSMYFFLENYRKKLITDKDTKNIKRF